MFVFIWMFGNNTLFAYTNIMFDILKKSGLVLKCIFGQKCDELGMTCQVISSRRISLDWLEFLSFSKKLWFQHVWPILEQELRIQEVLAAVLEPVLFMVKECEEIEYSEIILPALRSGVTFTVFKISMKLT